MNKILYYIHDLKQGGAETIVKDYALLINKELFDLVILCHDRINSPYEEVLMNAGVRIVYISDFIPFKKFYFSSLGHKIVCHSYLDKLIAKIIIKKESPDIIHTHLFCNSLIKFVNPSKKCKLFHTVHSQPEAYWCANRRASRIDFKACSYLIKKHSMRLVALNEPMRHELNEMFHVKDTVVLNNGIDFKKYDVAESKNSIRKSLNIREDAFLLGHVGRFVAVKNHALIIDSFSEICKKKEHAHLLLVGSGELRPEIEEKINRMQLSDKVTILESRMDIPRIMKALDVFVFPSFFEGLGIVLIEAQKMGIPCVISDAIPEAAVVSNLVTRMTKNSSPKQWAEQISNIKKIVPVYDRIEAWDMNVVVRQLENLYLYGING